MGDQLTGEEIVRLKLLLWKAKDQGYDIFQLEDFSFVLESEIRDQLAALDEPVFTNPTTGKAASSVFAVFDTLDYPRRR